MESGVPSGSKPLTEDTGILTVVEEEFECLYDVPFVTVNRCGGEIQAEVILSGVEEIDEGRIESAMKAAGERGYRAYARVFGEWGQVLLYFTDEPSKGLIWGLENEVGNAWLQ